MGVIEDIMSVIRKGPEAAGRLNSVKLNTKSVARGSKDATFQFPCLVPDSAPIDMSTTVARVLDQVYASFTQTWLSMNSMFDITIDPTPLSYLKRIHQNMKLEGVDIEKLAVDDEDLGRYMEKVYDGEYRLYFNESAGYGLLINQKNEGLLKVMEENKKLLSEHLSEFDLTPLEPITTEADSDHTSAMDLMNKVVDGKIQQAEQKRNLDMLTVTGRSSQAPRLTERELKRANDLVPYGLQVRMIALNDKKEFVQYIDVVIGIKTVLHLVQSDDMIENIARALQNRSLMFKFLRWTTGEISLMKDLIFNVNDMKADAINKRDGKSPFFGTLKRLKDKRVGFRNFTVPHALIPNATIVLTSYEVDYLQNKFAINLKSPVIGKKLINTLFLMAVVLIDEGSGTVSVLYDGDDTYQIYAYETLEREISMSNNKLGREIGRMISR